MKKNKIGNSYYCDECNSLVSSFARSCGYCEQREAYLKEQNSIAEEEKLGRKVSYYNIYND